MTDLAAPRQAYARKIMARAGVASPRLEEAYAAIPREDFVGPGPWALFRAKGYGLTEDADPRHLYDDVLVALVPEKHINNGQPSGHAMWLSAADAQAWSMALAQGIILQSWRTSSARRAASRRSNTTPISRQRPGRT